PIELVPQDITRVCLNLFSNGFYATTKRQREGGDASFKPTLKVSTRDLGDAVEVRIRDNGTGIPVEIKDKLFQPFFTTNSTVARSRSTAGSASILNSLSDCPVGTERFWGKPRHERQLALRAVCA